METLKCTAEQLRRLNKVCRFLGIEEVSSKYVSQEVIDEFLEKNVEWWFVSFHKSLRKGDCMVKRNLSKGLLKIHKMNLKDNSIKYDYIKNHILNRLKRYKHQIYTENEIDGLINVVKIGKASEIQRYLISLQNES